MIVLLAHSENITLDDYYNVCNMLAYFSRPHPGNKILLPFQEQISYIYLSSLMQIEKKVISYSIDVYQTPRTDLRQWYQEQLGLARASDHPEENSFIIQDSFGLVIAKETS